MWTGSNMEEIAELTEGSRDVMSDPSSTFLHINTQEGRMHCGVGDWLVRDAENRFYACKPDIFEATYEAVDVLKIV